MVKIEAGVELNCAVAWQAFRVWYDKRRSSECPAYSRDLNAAFEAAEKVGLWDFRIFEVGSDGEPSRVWFNEDWAGYEAERAVSEATTPALAICAAILKLADVVD